MKNDQLFGDLSKHLGDKIAQAIMDVLTLAPNEMRPALALRAAKVGICCASGVIAGCFNVGDTDASSDRVIYRVANLMVASTKGHAAYEQAVATTFAELAAEAASSMEGRAHG